MIKYMIPLVLLAAGAAHAQTTVTAKADVAYDPPVRTVPDSEGQTAVLQGALALTKYKIWVASTPVPATLDTSGAATIEVGPDVTETSYTTQAAVGTKLYVRVAACHQYGCSSVSNLAEHVVPAPANPEAPGNVSFTITIVSNAE